MNKQRSIFLFVAMLFLSVSAFAQTRIVTGTVTDENQEPLVAATVRVPDTNIGAITGIDGTFSIQVPDGAEAIEISSIGYTSGLIALDGANNYNVTLNTDALGLDEVVIIGYNAIKRKDLTGSVSSVDFDGLEDVPLPSATVGLQGRAAGVNVIKNSGTPGGGININVRGVTSINASNQPLYVVDGIPILDDNSDFTQEGVGNAQLSILADLDPGQIESLEVLKDAATAAIYGSRAANGVVLITTKRGSEGKTKIGINSSVGTQDPIRTIDVVDGPTYSLFIEEIFGAPSSIFGFDPTVDSDWQSEIFRNSLVQNHDVNISGGNAKTRFYSSLGYNDDEGIIQGSRFQRLSGRLNVDHKASDRFNFTMNLGYTNSTTDQIQNDNNIFGALSTAILLPPNVPIRNDDGSFGSAFGLENPVAASTVYDNVTNRDRLTGNVTGSFNIIDQLSIKSTIGVDLLNNREDVFEPSLLQSSANGRAVIGQIRNTRIINEHTLNYVNTWGDHTLSAIGGISFQEDQFNSTFTEAVDFPTDQFTGLSSGAQPVTTNGGFTGDNLQSILSSVNYNFDDRFFVTGTFRRDESSRFINDRVGYFPGVSAAWRLSEEDFIGNDGLFSDLKLRAGWGQTGNNNIGNFAAQQLFGGGNNFLDTPGTAPIQIGNPDLTWETTTQIGIGLDFSLLENRLGGSLDWYNKDTDDLLLNRPIPTTSGFLSVLENVGEVRNRGFEVQLTSLNIDKKDFRWSTSFNASFNDNEVISLVDGVPIDIGFGSRIAEGQPLNSFFGRVTDGLFQNQAEVDAHATQTGGTSPGDFRFRDLSGGAGPDGILGTSDDLGPDGIINDNDRAFLGDSNPDLQGGLTNTLSFKGFDLNAFVQFATGFEIYNNNLAFAEGLNSVFAPTVRAWENRWQQEGDITIIPRAVNGDPNGNRLDSDRFVEQGDYARLKTLTLGYTLPSSLIQNIGFSKIRVYGSGYNLATVTDYSWFDPEVSTFNNSNGASGTDFLTFPQAKSLVFGINVGL